MFGVLKGAPLYEISAQPKSSTKIITTFGLEVEKILTEKKENIKIKKYLLIFIIIKSLSLYKLV